MKIQRPKSVFTLMSDLALTLPHLEQQPTPLIDASFQQSLIQAEATLRAAVSARIQALINKRKATEAHRKQGLLMVRSVRDFHQSLIRAGKRDPEAQVWLEVFRLKQALPQNNTLTTLWYEQARQIASTGEELTAKLASAEMTTAAPLPSNPTAAEVATALQGALAAQTAYVEACVALKQAQSKARAANSRGLHLLGGLRKRLLALFDEHSPEARRLEMSRYGFRYASTDPQAAGDETASVPSDEPQTRTRELIPA